MTPDEILKAARKAMDEATSADLSNREAAADDLNFAIGNHWPEEVRAAREAEGKPCLTFNGLAQFIRQVTGQIRNLNPAIKVMAADGSASPDTAEVFEGLIRQIEDQSDASSVYEAATESAAACGVGHWRVRAQYADGDTFDQEIVIERIHNPFGVFWDPNAKDPTRKDARFCFIAESLHRDRFAELYPGKQAADATSDNRPAFIEHWCSNDNVTVAEYFWIEDRKHKIGMTVDGQIIRDPKPPMMFVKEREVTEPAVMWAKISGVDVLEGPVEIPCQYIPVVSVTGEEYHLGDTTFRSSVVRFAKDAQQLYNMARSAGAEIIAMQPKAPFLVTGKQIAGLESLWADANTASRPYLPYNPDERAGPPQRLSPPVPSSAILSEIQLASEDMKRTTGIYDASLGAQSNEKSGIAIRERKSESQNSTSVYADNMVKGVNHTGRILVSMIPRIYDTRRVIRILGEDDQEKQVAINDVMRTMDGEMPVNDLTVGKYDVRIGVGPNYSTKRQEASEGMFEFLRVVPGAAAITADLVAKSQDWPDAERFAERLKKGLPPGMVEQDDMPPEQAQQMQQAQQQQMQQAQMAAQMQAEAQKIEMRKAAAEAAEAEADAQKAAAEAQKAQMEIAQMTGQLDAAFQQRVSAEVARALQSFMQPQPMGPL